MDSIKEAKKVFDTEILALEKTRDTLDETFIKILTLIVECKGKVVITGMGKPGHIAKKLAATFSSLGTPAFCLHPAEAMHGDLGMISSDDLVIAISYSGESDEIVRILPNIKLIGATIVGITGNADSTLARQSDYVQVLPPFEEACYLGLAPTSSTTAVLCYGDALAVVASGINHFKDVDFGKFHPAGSLGKKLLITVNDLMKKGLENAVINSTGVLMDAIVQLADKGLGIVNIVDSDYNLLGVITDGDLRRLLIKKADIYSLGISNVMTKDPYTIESGRMAVEALQIMRENNIGALPVLDSGKVIGTIRLQTIIKYGII